MDEPLYAEGESADPLRKRKILLLWEEFEMPAMEFLAEMTRRINDVPEQEREYITVWCDDGEFVMMYDPDYRR